MLLGGVGAGWQMGGRTEAEWKRESREEERDQRGTETAVAGAWGRRGTDMQEGKGQIGTGDAKCGWVNAEGGKRECCDLDSRQANWGKATKARGREWIEDQAEGEGWWDCGEGKRCRGGRKRAGWGESAKAWRR